MPIYMDIHNVPGVEALDAAEAHQKDMQIQHEYRCKCMTYWIDEPRGVVFCLIEAPDKSTVEEMHERAHGLIPHKIIEVNNEIVYSFLGRIHDPEQDIISDNGLKVFKDSAFRILLTTDTKDPVLLKNELGLEEAGKLLNCQNDIIRSEISTFSGREVEHAGNSFVASFTTAAKALKCALEIQNKITADDRKLGGIKIVLTGGEPVSASDRIFGDAIQLGKRLSTTVSHGEIIVASVVKDLLNREDFQLNQKPVRMYSAQDEMLIETIYKQLDKNWQDSDFDVEQFCKKISMSKSQLYRKTMMFWNLPPNQLLKEFRLDRAREMLRNQSNNISQTTFDAGFTSPSYFAKCFKKKFGLSPAGYQQTA